MDDKKALKIRKEEFLQVNVEWHHVSGDDAGAMAVFTLPPLCRVWTEEFYCNRCKGAYLAAQLLSSLSKQLRDQRQPEQSMSTVIGLTCHGSQLENHYSCWSHLGGSCPVASVWKVDFSLASFRTFMIHQGFRQCIITASEVWPENTQSSCNIGQKSRYWPMSDWILRNRHCSTRVPLKFSHDGSPSWFNGWVIQSDISTVQKWLRNFWICAPVLRT